MKEIEDLLSVIEKLNNQEKEINNLKNELSRRKGLEVEISNLKKEIDKQHDFITKTPQLSHTALGRSTSDGKIIFRNWWISYKGEFEGILDENWFTQFVQHRFPNEDYRLNFFSIWNNHYNIKEDMPGKKIFYTPSDLSKLHADFNEKYGLYALDYVDLALGFDYIDNSKYLRFPYWITQFINPKATDEDIENVFENLNSASFQKSKDVVNINDYDMWGTRLLIASDVEKYADIEYGGVWRRNTDNLVVKYNNNILRYIQDFKFNICAEDVIDEGFVTEKIFNAIKMDCIPLYAGSGESVEPNILNDNAILHWYANKDNSDTVELFKNLLTDEKSYKEFKDQDIILDSATKTVIRFVSDFEKKLSRLISD